MDAQLDATRAKLKGLKELLDAGLISVEDFERSKQATLAAFTSSSSSLPAAASSSQQQTTTEPAAAEQPQHSMAVTLECDAGEPTLVRCGVHASFQQSGRKGASSAAAAAARKQVTVLLLDRSGSMRDQWGRVVDSLQALLAQRPQLLEHLRVVVYADEAVAVDTEGGAGELLRRLRRNHAPTDQLTFFRAAFREAVDQVQRELVGRRLKDTAPELVDVSLLLFTDGCDTSIFDSGTGKIDAKASAQSANKHYAAMRRDFDKLKLGSLAIDVCAFGEHHDPKQCQSFGDRYVYVDRPETLRDRLERLIGEMASGTGYCSLKVRLPQGLSLVEQIPGRLPLDGNASIEYEFFVSGTAAQPQSPFSIEASSVGFELCEYRGPWQPSTLDPRSFEALRFAIDRAASQLRMMSARLTGSHATAKDIGDLRALLDLCRRDLAPVRVAAMWHGVNGPAAVDGALLRQAKTGGITLGRAAPAQRERLRNGLRVVDSIADRLSHVVGEFERGSMTDARVAAILGDSRQHLPQAVRRQLDKLSVTNVQRITERRAILEALPHPLPPLSAFGKDFTKCPLSCCDAHEVASEGDALFFFLTLLDRNVATAHITQARDGDGFVSFDSFMLMREHGVKQTQDINCTFRGVGQSIQVPWLPCFFSEMHFRRSLLFLPDALGLVASGDVLAYKPSQHALLFELFGRSALQVPFPEKREIDHVMFLHKFRAMHAVCAEIRDPSGQTLAEALAAKLEAYQAKKAPCKEARDLFEITTALLLSDAFRAPEDARRVCASLYQDALRLNLSAMLSRIKCDAQIETIAALRATLGILPKQQASPSPVQPFSSLVLPATAREIAEAISSSKPAPAVVISAISSSQQPNGFSPSDANSLFNLLVALEGAPPRAELFGMLDAVLAKDDKDVLSRFEELVNRLKANRCPAQFLDDEQELACIVRALVTHSGQGDAADPLSDPKRVVENARALVLDHFEREERERARAHAERLAARNNLLRRHPLHALKGQQDRCICGEVFNRAHVSAVWGDEAAVDNPVLFRTARKDVLSAKHFATVALIDAATDKRYRELGGTFTFSPGDTFIPGLHRRTVDLLREWEHSRHSLDTTAAVSELLLRLRWDDRDAVARKCLSRMLEFLWLAYRGKGPQKSDIPTCLFEL